MKRCSCIALASTARCQHRRRRAQPVNRPAIARDAGPSAAPASLHGGSHGAAELQAGALNLHR